MRDDRDHARRNQFRTTQAGEIDATGGGRQARGHDPGIPGHRNLRLGTAALRRQRKAGHRASGARGG
jgi:hypothetical protein